MAKRFDNKRVLAFSCLHAPYHHKDSLEFLSAVKAEYDPDRILNLGDEVDNQAIKFWPKDPDLFSAGRELKEARKALKKLEVIYPRMDIVKSNHGSLVHRRVIAAGLPRGLIKSYNSIYGIGPGWKWHTDLNLTMSDRSPWYFCHGKRTNALNMSKALGCNTAQGHYHNSFLVSSWMNTRNTMYWGVQVGTLIDDSSYSYNYNKASVFRPMLGCCVILDGVPRLVPMSLKKSGRWTGRL
jgi:hypothetical protein